MKERSLHDQVRDTLKQLHFTPQRLLGQNFLCDSDVVKRIAAVRPLGEGDRLLEIGPGLGVLTEVLADTGASVTGLELDDDLAAYLQAKFILKENVSIVRTDALKFDCGSFAEGQAFRVYANVPYSITTPLLKKLFTQGGNWRSLTLMLQKEAALRVVEGRGRSNGPLTMLAHYYGECRLLFDVPPASFWPPPQVNSAVIDIKRREQPPVAGDIDSIMSLVEAGFKERRKLLLNSLSAVTGYDRDYWQQGLAACGLDTGIRAEQLSLSDFARLDFWHNYKKKTSN